MGWFWGFSKVIPLPVFSENDFFVVPSIPKSLLSKSWHHIVCITHLACTAYAELCSQNERQMFLLLLSFDFFYKMCISPNKLLALEGKNYTFYIPHPPSTHTALSKEPGRYSVIIFWTNECMMNKWIWWTSGNNKQLMNICRGKDWLREIPWFRYFLSHRKDFRELNRSLNLWASRFSVY